MSNPIDAAWLRDPTLQAVLAALSGGGEEARVVGGAVRNHLLGQPISDVDIATTALPEETVRRGEAAGFRAVPTGIAHGTVTLVKNGHPFEVTTLRHDAETDGRHARVIFGRDWQADAGRRDFTINALYCDADGRILDLVGGVPDIATKTLRFIGDAAARIEEDHLRTLRFFRFFAWYGEGRPDAEAIRAVTRLKSGLATLSAERVRAELEKLLAAPDPSRALLWMRQTGVLSAVLPESDKWGIDAIHGLVDTERAFGWQPDPLLRLMAIVPPDAARLAALAARLRFSGSQRDRLTAFAMEAPVPPSMDDPEFRVRLCSGDRAAIIDGLKLALAAARARGSLEDAAIFIRRLEGAERFAGITFPVSGEDLKAAGLTPGPAMGKALKELKVLWAQSGFVLGREALLQRLAPKP